MILKAAILAGALAATVVPGTVPVAQPAKISAIDRVWSAHSVEFALAVTEKAILVAYYDANRQLTVARRDRRGSYWTYHRLASWTGWDSHNGIAMAVDAVGQVHVVANLHNDPLVYFRTEEGDDVRSFERINVMANTRLERRMTYPVFLHDAGGGLIFKYRDGGSGNGNEIYNRYDPAARRWGPLLSTPLTDGEGKRNAYFVGPTLGPDGYFHLAWVWRETPDAETNHDLSYARSQDLVRWERSDGRPLALPIKLSDAEIVDPVPIRGGMINNNTVVGFDATGRPMITYHKFDAAGDTQIFVARRAAQGWQKVQISDWSGFRWDFRGGGSLDSRLLVSGAVPAGQDRVRVAVVRDGKPIDFLLDAVTLKRVAEQPGTAPSARIASRIPVPHGMVLHMREDPSGIAVVWPTLPPSRDRAPIDITDPTVLRLVEPGWEDERTGPR